MPEAAGDPRQGLGRTGLQIDYDPGEVPIPQQEIRGTQGLIRTPCPHPEDACEHLGFQGVHIEAVPGINHGEELSFLGGLTDPGMQDLDDTRADAVPDQFGDPALRPTALQEGIQSRNARGDGLRRGRPPKPDRCPKALGQKLPEIHDVAGLGHDRIPTGGSVYAPSTQREPETRGSTHPVDSLPRWVGQRRSVQHDTPMSKPRLTPSSTVETLKALRILFISDSASPHTGGLNRMVVETCSWLGKAGHDVALAYHDEHPSLVECPVFRVREALPMPERQAALEKAVATFQPDVLYCHSIKVMPSLPGLSERFPLASFYHDQSIFCSGGDRCSRDWEPCHRPHGWSCLLWHAVIGCGGKHPINNWRRWKAIDARMLAWKLPRSRVQVASRFMQRGLEENGFPVDRLDLVPLCAEPPPADASIATEPGLLLVPGRMVKSKGIDLAIRAVAQLQDLPCRLVVAGDGPQRAALEQLTRDLGVTPRVTFTGEILPTELASWYARASVILFPVLRPEPFGLIGVEALAYGKPIVAFDGGAVDEWLWPGETGIKVEERTPEAFALALRELVRDPQRCAAMGQAAKRRHAFFHPDAFVQRLTQALDRAIRWHRDTGSTPRH